MKEYALITGASKGIGKSIALELAKKGYNLLLVARNEADLQDLGNSVKKDYGVEVAWLRVDLSEAGAADAVFNWVNNINVPVSVLINNAGYGMWGNFDELEIKQQLSMVRVNIDALIELSYLLLPLLKRRQQAFIFNVASTAAYQAVPTLAVYSASKAFVLSFSRALRFELKNSPVSVSCLCPGPTDTGFAHRAGMDALAELAAKFNMSPADVAAIGIKGMFKKKAEIVPGFLNKVSAAAARHSPKALIESVTAGLYKH